MVAGSSIAESLKPLTLKSPIAAMAGIGPKRAEALAAKGIVTIEDLLFHLPARYQDWRDCRAIAQLEPGTIAVVERTLTGLSDRFIDCRRRLKMTEKWAARRYHQRERGILVRFKIQ